MDAADAGASPLSPELLAVQRSLLALIDAARATLDAVEAVVAEPRTFAAGAHVVQQAASVATPVIVGLAASLLTPSGSST